MPSGREAKRLQGGKSVGECYVAETTQGWAAVLFNRQYGVNATMRLALEDFVGSERSTVQRWRVRDLWQHRDLGEVSSGGFFKAVVPSEDVVMLTLVPVTPWEGLRIDPESITVSGISSGADFAVQFSVAHSAIIQGTGVFAGQGYHCAVHRFPEDELTPPNPSVPICDGCPANRTLLYDHCKSHPEWVDPQELAAYARKQASLGHIDGIGNLSQHPVYLYRGTMDSCYTPGAEAAVIGFFRELSPAIQRGVEPLIAFENTIPSLHAQPTIHAGSPCGGPYNGSHSYLASCGYDGAGACLQHLYGRDNLRPPSHNADNARGLRKFPQDMYMKPGSDAGLADEAYIFIPPACAEGRKVCRLHVWFHGCGGPAGSPFYESSVRYAGFNEWAETNDFVIFYPAMRSWGTTSQQQAGCWDGYGQTGSDYALKSGQQIMAVRNMVQALAGA